MKKKILMVDDDVDFVSMNKAVLENLGYETDECYEAKDCMAKIKEFHPDLIMMDVMMEHYDSGFTLSYKVKTTPETKDIPIVMVTSVHRETNIKFDAETAEEKNWIKVDEFIEKPVSPEDLAATVSKYLEG